MQFQKTKPPIETRQTPRRHFTSQAFESRFGTSLTHTTRIRKNSNMPRTIPFSAGQRKRNSIETGRPPLPWKAKQAEEESGLNSKFSEDIRSRRPRKNSVHRHRQKPHNISAPLSSRNYRRCNYPVRRKVSVRRKGCTVRETGFLPQ